MRDENAPSGDLVDMCVEQGRRFLNSELIRSESDRITNWGFRHTLLVEPKQDGSMVFTVFPRVIRIDAYAPVRDSTLLPRGVVVHLDGSNEWRQHKRLWVRADSLKTYYASPDRDVYVNTHHSVVCWTKR